MKSNKKAVSLIFLVCAFICWLLFRELFETLWAIAKLPVPMDFILKPWDMIAIVLGATAFIVLIKNAKVVTFTNEVIMELSRVVWPNRKETAISTGVISVLVSICAMILFGFDMLWGALIRIFYQS